MATRPLPSQYNTDSMHRSHPLWACKELWVKFRRQYVCRLCLSEQYSTTVHSGLGLGLPSVSQLFHSANNSASIPWKLVEQQLFRWNGQFHNLSTRISTTTQNLVISHFWWNMLNRTTHSMFWLWSGSWGLFYEIFNVLPWSGKVQEKIYTRWNQLLFCVLDNWQERQKETAAEESNYSGCQWPSLWKLGGAFVSTLRLSSEEHSSPKSALQSKTCRRSQFTIALRMSKRGRHLVVQLWQCKYIFCCCARNRKWITGQVKIFLRIWDVCVSAG